MELAVQNATELVQEYHARLLFTMTILIFNCLWEILAGFLPFLSPDD